MYTTLRHDIPKHPPLIVEVITRSLATHARFAERPEEWEWLLEQVRDALRRLSERT